MSPAILIALTAGPALAIGATLWFVTTLVPECVLNEHQRLTAPDNAFDLVTFSRSCGDTPANTQAALVPPGEAVPFDAASFFSVTTDADLSPRWTAANAIEITRPTTGEVLRQDANVAGVAVTYR